MLRFEKLTNNTEHDTATLTLSTGKASSSKPKADGSQGELRPQFEVTANKAVIAKLAFQAAKDGKVALPGGDPEEISNGDDFASVAAVSLGLSIADIVKGKLKMPEWFANGEFVFPS